MSRFPISNRSSTEVPNTSPERVLGTLSSPYGSGPITQFSRNSPVVVLGVGQFENLQAYYDAAAAAAIAENERREAGLPVPANNPPRPRRIFFLGEKPPQEPTGTPIDDGPLTPPRPCPDPNTLILLSDGSQKRAGDLQVGDVVKTQHEDTLEWGEHKITYVEIVSAEKLVLTFDHTEFVCSTSHKFYVEGKGWIEVNQMEIGDFVIGLDKSHELLEVKEGTYGDVVVIQVEDAHTYISEGLLSHNKTILPPDTGGPVITSEPGGPIFPPGPPGGTFIPGTPTLVPTTTTTTTTRTGTSTRISTTSTTNRSIGNKLVSLDVLPYMRSRNIEFIAKKLKPNTLLYPFFDSQNVYGYVVPKILEIEMISGTFVTGETVSGMNMIAENVNVSSTATETSIQFRLATYNHKYGPYNNPTDVFSSSPYNIAEQLQPYSPSSTTLNVDTTSLSDLSLGTYGGNVFIGMTLIGNQSGATARVVRKRLVSDNVGTVIGSFFVPNPNRAGNPRFSTGNKTFRLTDNPTNGTIGGTLYTYANANFFADGLITQSQETILSIRNVETQTAFINETVPITNTTVTTVDGEPVFVPTFTPQGPGPGPTPGPSGGGGDAGPGPQTPTGGGPTPTPTPTPTGAVTFTTIQAIGLPLGPRGRVFEGAGAKQKTEYIDSNGDGLYDTIRITTESQSLLGAYLDTDPGANIVTYTITDLAQQQLITSQITPYTDLGGTAIVRTNQGANRPVLLAETPTGETLRINYGSDNVVGIIQTGRGLLPQQDVAVNGPRGPRNVIDQPTITVRLANGETATIDLDPIILDLPAGLTRDQNGNINTSGVAEYRNTIIGASLPSAPYGFRRAPGTTASGGAADPTNTSPFSNIFPTTLNPSASGRPVQLNDLPLNQPLPYLPGRSPASQPPAAIPPTFTTTTKPGVSTPTSSRGFTTTGPSSLPPQFGGTIPAAVPSAPTPAAQPVAFPAQVPQARTVISTPAPAPIAPASPPAVQSRAEAISAAISARASSNSRGTAGCSGIDPLAQTFKIGSDEDQTGRFITSVDIFFYSKATDLPVYVELRSVELGTPTQKIYPFSKVELLPENINISETGTVATRVTFQAPIFLEGNKEHALVLLSDSNDYSVFISRLGEVDITTAGLPESQQRLVTTQPTLGSLFKSQNASTWTPSQYEDLKFNMYAAVFEPTGSVSFFNPELNRSNDQIAILRNNALDVESRRVRVGLGTTLSSATIADLTEGSFVRQRDTNAIGDFAYVTGIATGSLSIPNAGIGYTPSVGVQTYSNVTLTTVSGFGRGATANITVTNGVITAAGISSGGTGYQVGEILTADAIGITSIGRNLRLSVRQLSAFNELVVDNVQGEFEVGVAKSIQYYSANPGVGYTDLNGGSVFANNINVEREGLYIDVKHRNHGMHAITNVVSISNAISDIAPIKLTNDVERDFTGNLVVTGLTTAFNTFENVGISSTNPGYLVVNSEIISYTGVSGNSFTGITRGVDSTLQIRHPANSFVYKYELAGVSLRRINTTHTLQDVTERAKKNTLDSYYIKIDPSTNGVNRSTGVSFPKLYLNSTKSTGGPIIEATQNIPYDIAQPIVQTFTPPQTTITASMRTISGSSVDGAEESFLDRGTQTIKLNEDNFFDNPRIIASRVNERLFLNNIIQGNKSLEMTLNLSTTNQYLSPVIDLDRVGMVLVSNRVNSPVADYVNDDRVSLLETDPNAFIYASKPIGLEVPATSIKVIVSANLNIYNDLRAMFAIMKDVNETPIYYPFPGNGNITSDGRTINISNNTGRPDLPLKVTSKLGFQSEELTFIDYEFTINGLESFKYFSIKLIGSSTSQTYPPRLRDLRIIALA